MSRKTYDTAQTIYIYLRNYIHDYGYAPSQREIAKNCYVGLGSVARHLDILVARGKITRQQGQPRSIHLIEVDVPHLPLDNR